jgi:hypothetical protein
MTGFLRWPTCAGIAAVLLFCAQAAGAAQTPHGQAAVPRSPSPGTLNRLQGVQALSPTDAWAAGFYCKSCTQFGVTDRTLILHWNGTSWAKVRSPNPGASNDLSGISADSAADAWAVGSVCTPGCTSEVPLLLHWNGTAWSKVSGPVLSFGGVLNGVSALAPDDAWAVGFTGNGQTLILHWNGTVWAKVPSPNPADTTLWGVSADSATDAWAVGTYCASGCTSTPVFHTLILHWNGTAWAKMPSPSPGTGYSDLQGVSAVSPTVAFASGTFGTNGASLLVQWNGTTWVKVRAPNVFGILWGVSASSATDAWAVGGLSFLHWNGTKWATVAFPGSAGYFGVSADSTTDAWAVGSVCGNSNCSPEDTLTLHWNGRTWSRQ